MNRVTEDLNISPPDFSRLQDRFNRAVRNAGAVLFIERTWPRVVSTACTTGLFVSTSWFGLWHALPPGGRMAGVLAFATALAVSPFLPKSGSPIIRRHDALRRLDQNAGATAYPGPITLIDDRPDGALADDPYWRSCHESRLQKWANKIQAGKPQPNMAGRDPYRLRYMIAAMTVAAAVYSGPSMQSDVRKAFDWAAPVVPTAPLEIKAWVRAPEGATTINDRILGEDDLKNDIKAYDGSTLIIQAYGTKPEIRANNIIGKPEKEIAPRTGTNGKTTYQYAIPLHGTKMTIAITNGPLWNFSIEKAASPDVTLHGVQPKPDNINKLELEYSIKSERDIRRGEIEINQSKNPEDGAQPLPSARLPKILLNPQPQ